jgi:methyltransferase-like protein 23
VHGSDSESCKSAVSDVWSIQRKTVIQVIMAIDDKVRPTEFTFGAYTLHCECRKELDQTINFRLTLQCEVEDLFESLRDFGGGWNGPQSDSETDSLPSPAATSSPTNLDGALHCPENSVHKPDLLGLDIWPAALELCQYLIRLKSIVERANILELGAGVGLPGLLAAKMGATNVVLTDYEQSVVDHAARNAMLCGVADRCIGMLLDWTHLEDLPALHRHTYSLVLAADVLYIQELMPYFVTVMTTLMAPGGIAVIAHQTRRALVLSPDGTPEMREEDVSFLLFRKLCDDAGLCLRVLGSRESPGFPGPMMLLAVAMEADVIAALPATFPGDGNDDVVI